ncbi:fatty-acid O-methyltransferase [Mycobacterium sp. MFM001]|nr:fatty-acid O-methyltransferase [Mycobacterium sp. MFM001]
MGHMYMSSFPRVQTTASQSFRCHTLPMPRKDQVIPSTVWRLHQQGQKYIYPYFTRRLAARDVLFLNYGYEEDPPMAVPLEASDEPHRYSIQLYHRTATQADISGKQVLEVGCGHGGGASYLTRTFHPASYTALDLNSAAIAFCRKRHNLASLEFVQGDAENLPFPDQSFDAVINVESSIHYPQFSRFLAEVARVLRPGGHFQYTDARFREHIADWEAALAGAPMRMLSQPREINEEVIRGMERNSQEWPDLIDRRMLRLLFGLTRDNADVRNSQVYRNLQSGRLSYRMYCFAKA